MHKIIGADELVAKGVTTDVTNLRPVLSESAAKQANNFMANNATLRKDEWRMIDDKVNDVLRQRLTIVDDFRSFGMVTPVSLGTVLRVTERISDFDAADVSFDGDTAPQKDRPNYSNVVIPVPVISKDFQIAWRQLEASRQRGEPLDTTAAAVAARKVKDKLQYLFVNGYTQGPGANPTSGTDGQSIPGLQTHASRLTQAKSASWGLASTDIIGDTQKMLKKAYDNYLFGPFYLYVPKNAWSVLQMDYSATVNPTKTFIQRILDFVDIKAVRPLDDLSDDNVMLTQMTEDTADLSEAQAPTTVQWDKNPFVTMFRVLTVAGPHIKTMENQAGTVLAGYVHLS